MKQLAPDAKLLIVLRDPVARAYSHYWHNIRYASLKESQQKKRRGSNWEHITLGNYATDFLDAIKVCVAFNRMIGRSKAELQSHDTSLMLQSCSCFIYLPHDSVCVGKRDRIQQLFTLQYIASIPGVLGTRFICCVAPSIL